MVTRIGEKAPAAASFPLRVAAIDMGSNAIRYMVADFSRPGNYVEVAGERIAVRLGRDVFTRERRLSPETMAAGVSALVQIRRRLDDLGVNHYRAVATSAVRESRNGGEFVELLRRESGIHVETISGSEEARLVWLAVRSRIPLEGSRWFLMDLGGGSVEVSVVSNEGMLWSESHTLGSVRLLQAFSDEAGAVTGPDYRTLLERYVHTLKVPEAASEWHPVGLIATGGNIEALASLAGANANSGGVSVLSLEALQRVLSQLTSLTYDERVQELGLRVDRADVIVPAAVVYERVAELASASEILVPEVGIKEGLLLDLVDDLHDPQGHLGRRDRELLEAAIALGRRYRFDEGHARKVTELSLSLFDQLMSLHGLEREVRRVLLTAGLLHDIGQFISYRRHHKHSQYIIANSELPDLSPSDIGLASQVARYHRRSGPKPGHPEFDALDTGGQDVVLKLSAMLRVADALDREHVGRVASLRPRVGKSVVTLEVAARGGLALEEWALRKKGRVFEDVFGRSVQLEAKPIRDGSAVASR